MVAGSLKVTWVSSPACTETVFSTTTGLPSRSTWAFNVYWYVWPEVSSGETNTRLALVDVVDVPSMVRVASSGSDTRRVAEAMPESDIIVPALTAQAPPAQPPAAM